MDIEIKKSVDGEFYFVVKAANGETIAVSELYKTKQSCKKGIKILVDNVHSAKTVDRTVK